MNEGHYQLFRAAIFGLCIFAASMLLIPTLAHISKSLDARHWPTYTGEVTAVSANHSGGYVFRYGRPAKPAVTYHYEREGKSIKGTTVGFGISHPQQPLIKGDFVRVYVNPQDSTEAVIAVGIFQSHIIKLIVSFIFVALGAFLWRRM